MKTPLSLALLICCSVSLAQEAPSEPYKPVFPIVFPHPTGLNGYEEIVRAGDLAKAHEGLNKAFGESVTLTEKRRILRDGPLIEARKLLRAGLEKPIKQPGSEVGDDARFLAFAGIRQLGRLLMVEQYVLFADGKVGEAIDSARDGLRLGYAVSRQMVIGGLVGIAVNAIAIRGIANHLDQLSARDCERLTKLASDWLSMPDPGVEALEAEREYALKQVHASLGGDSRITPEVHALISGRIRSVQYLLKQDPWKRGELPPLEGSGAALEYVRRLSLDESYERVLDSYTTDLAKVQMLGVHAAIRRFRWEHNRLPANLDELKLGRLALDPFTGKPFIYLKTSDSAYTLSSVKVKRL